MRFSGQNVTCEIATSFWLSLCESALSQWGPAPGQGHLSGPRPRPSVGGVLGRAGSGAERITSCGENWPHRLTCARPRLGRGAWCVVLCRGRQKWTCGCGHFRARAKAPGSFPPGGVASVLQNQPILGRSGKRESVVVSQVAVLPSG